MTFQLEDVIPRVSTDSGHMFLMVFLTVGLLSFLTKLQWSPSACQIVLIHCNVGPTFYQASSLLFLVSVRLIPLSACLHHQDVINVLRLRSSSKIINLSTFLIQSFNFSFWA